MSAFKSLRKGGRRMEEHSVRSRQERKAENESLRRFTNEYNQERVMRYKRSWEYVYRDDPDSL